MNRSKARDFDYEEDDYDHLKSRSKNIGYHQNFTNKATLKKTEFDYEEDPYEPGQSK